MLIVSDGFCNCNAAAFHNNGINTVVVLETAEYRIIRFKLAVKKKGEGLLECCNALLKVKIYKSLADYQPFMKL